MKLNVPYSTYLKIYGRLLLNIVLNHFVLVARLTLLCLTSTVINREGITMMFTWDLPVAGDLIEVEVLVVDGEIDRLYHDNFCISTLLYEPHVWKAVNKAYEDFIGC